MSCVMILLTVILMAAYIIVSIAASACLMGEDSVTRANTERIYFFRFNPFYRVIKFLFQER